MSNSIRPVYSYNPEQALDLLTSKPKAFLLLGLIIFKLNHGYRNKYHYDLTENEVYLSFDDVYMKYKPALTRSGFETSINNLVIFGFISIRESFLFKRKKIARVLVNPFSSQREE